MRSAARSKPSISFEVIVVNDASTDDTSQILSQIAGIRVLTNSQNLGFIGSCNRGAAKASGKYICFLNNDTQVLPGWLENLISTMEENRRVGAVGAKLIYPDGNLQEAGGVVWDDARAWNYGKFSDRLESANEPEYNYLRQVDYCSAACLLVRRDLFLQIGGFSQLFFPAYYEDTDLCFELRKLGYKVLYQPHSVVIHYEGVTAGVNPANGIKQNQIINRRRFLIKWQAELTHHYSTEHLDRLELSPRRLLATRTVLMIVPFDSQLCQAIAQTLIQLGYRIVFLSEGLNQLEISDRENSQSEEMRRFQSMGIEVLYPTAAQPNLFTQLEKRIKWIDLVWSPSPELADKYAEIFALNSSLRFFSCDRDRHQLEIKD
jgi:O-antigen biosynthesis protein